MNITNEFLKYNIRYDGGGVGLEILKRKGLD